MIKVTTENGQTSVKLNGGFKELCADSMCVIECIHSAFKQESDEVAEKFERFFKKNVDSVFNGDHEHIMLAHASGKDEMRKLLEHLKEMIGDED